MTALIEIGLPVLAVLVLGATWAALPHSRTPRHGDPSWSQRAGAHIRKAHSAVRAWWAARRALAAVDQETIAWLDVVHDDQVDADADRAVLAAAANRYHEEMGLGPEFFPEVLPAPVDVPGRETGSAPRPAPAPAGDTPEDMGPGAGPTEPVTTVTCVGAEVPPKVDSPAPAEPPVPVPAAVQWARNELTGHHLPANTGAFPKVTGVA